MKKCCLQEQKLQIHWCGGSILPLGNRFLSSFVFILWHRLRGGFIFSYFVASYSIGSIVHVFRWICPHITCLVKWTASQRPFFPSWFVLLQHLRGGFMVSLLPCVPSCVYSHGCIFLCCCLVFVMHVFIFAGWSRTGKRVSTPPHLNLLSSIPRVVVAFSVEEMQAEIGCVEMFVIDGQSSVLSRWIEACSRAYSGKGCELWGGCFDKEAEWEHHSGLL